MLRRTLLRRASLGFGWLGVQNLLGEKPVVAGPAVATAHPPKAKSVILCYLSGGLSQVDSFDPKPQLNAMAGQPMPMPVRATMFNNVGTIFPSPWKFQNYGDSGMPISDLFPEIATMADDLCLIRSMTSTANEHAQGNFHFHSGFSFQGHPSAGAWMSYGLGSLTSDLPTYVVLRSGGAVDPIGGAGIYNNGFLPAKYQPSFMTVDRDPALPDLKPSESSATQRRKIDAMKAFDQRFNRSVGGDTKIEAAIENYETAFQMQSSVPEVCDLGEESEVTRKLYGLDSSDEGIAAFAKQCITARRLVERGVRFIELSSLPRGKVTAQKVNPWDQHSNLKEEHAINARQVDQPIAGLLKDLKSRGLLDETIVIFSGEFGRTPFAQGANGRDHNPFGYSLWVAGGGFRGGTIYGATDEFGYHTVENRLTIYDLWATVQHQLGLNHETSTYRFSGRDYRLSDVEGHVIQNLI